MVSIIALIGRPNVGKSTLFNCLTDTRDALVTNSPGLTRDRKYGYIKIEDHEFVCIDTGGIKNPQGEIETRVIEQSFLAIEEANLILFIVDARAGLLPEDLEIAKHLRFQKRKKLLLVANKIDGINIDQAMIDFWSLGLGKIYPVSASCGRGVRNLMKDILLSFIDEETLSQKQEQSDKNWHVIKSKEITKEKLKECSDSRNFPIKLAIIGRPNVGKSSLTNSFLGEDRMIVYDMPGTTRDSVHISMWHDKRRYILIDTAGIRKHAKISDISEKFSVVQSLQVIRDADVILLVLDAKEGVFNQDLSLISFILNSGRPLVVAVNKWDCLNRAEKEQVKKTLNYRLGCIDFIRVHFISALYDIGISDLLISVSEAYENTIQRIKASVLTNIMNMAIKNHQPPLCNRRRIKLKYAHSGGYNPLIIVIHGNQVEEIPKLYKRYLTNYFCKSLNLMGSLVHLRFKEGKNPYIKKHLFKK